MGMYTELHYNATLRADVPDDVVSVLRFMVNDGDEPESKPEHAPFATDRWRMMLTCDSYCFDADTHSTLRWDDIGNCWCLCIRSNLKNYCDEIEKFVDWVRPYVDKQPGDFLGFSRYEETETPTLIFAT